MKNQSKQAQKIAQKRQEKARLRKGKKHQTIQTLNTKGIFPSKREFDFWRAHGVNYILSDYDEATWTPMFSDIYDGVIPDANTVIQDILAKFGPDSGNWPPEGRAALGWAVSPEQVLAVYYMEAKRRILEKLPDETIEDYLHAPHNAIVWELFNYLKTELANKTA